MSVKMSHNSLKAKFQKNERRHTNSGYLWGKNDMKAAAVQTNGIFLYVCVFAVYQVLFLLKSVGVCNVICPQKHQTTFWSCANAEY